MRRTLAVRRVSGVVHARALRNFAREPLEWAALKALDVRLSLLARGDRGTYRVRHVTKALTYTQFCFI